MIDFLRLFQKRGFVLSSEHVNLGTLISCLKRAEMYKRLLSLITAKRKDRDSFGSSLCNP